MLTEYEAQKLRGDMEHELNATDADVHTCALMLLFLVGLAWVGAASDTPEGRESGSPRTQAMTKGAPSSKDVFDERRRRFIETYPDSHVAREGRLQGLADANADGGYFAYGY